MRVKHFEIDELLARHGIAPLMLSGTGSSDRRAVFAHHGGGDVKFPPLEQRHTLGCPAKGGRSKSTARQLEARRLRPARG